VHPNLVLPVADNGHPADDDKGPPVFSEVLQSQPERHHLVGLSEAHVVAQQPTEPITAEEPQPFHPPQPIGAQMRGHAGYFRQRCGRLLTQKFAREFPRLFVASYRQRHRAERLQPQQFHAQKPYPAEVFVGLSEVICGRKAVQSRHAFGLAVDPAVRRGNESAAFGPGLQNLLQ
jgi:hypothetical protein